MAQLFRPTADISHIAAAAGHSRANTHKSRREILPVQLPLNATLTHERVHLVNHQILFLHRVLNTDHRRIESLHNLEHSSAQSSFIDDDFLNVVSLESLFNKGRLALEIIAVQHLTLNNAELIASKTRRHNGHKRGRIA